jgi:hypothetical protein
MATMKKIAKRRRKKKTLRVATKIKEATREKLKVLLTAELRRRHIPGKEGDISSTGSFDERQDLSLLQQLQQQLVQSCGEQYHAANPSGNMQSPYTEQLKRSYAAIVKLRENLG